MPHKMNIMDNWDQVRKVMKHQHPELTDADLYYVQGNEDELYERISQRTKLSPEHIRTFIEGLHLAL